MLPFLFYFFLFFFWPRRAELSEPFSLAFTGEEGGSAPAPPRGEAFPAGDQRRPEHAAVGEQHQPVWLRGRPAPRPRASPTTDPPKPWLWNAGDGEERRGSWPQPGLGQIGSTCLYLFVPVCIYLYLFVSICTCLYLLCISRFETTPLETTPFRA